MLSLRTHNILDYVVGVFLLLVPALFGFEDVETARNVFLLSGAALILYSLLTNYQYSALKLVPLGVHMAFDAAIGLVLLLAPWLFNYNELVTGSQIVVHAILGLAAMGLVAFTRSRTEAEKRVNEPPEPGRFSPTGRV